MLINGSKIFEDVSSSEVSNNSIFLDSSDSKLKYKDDGGAIEIFTNTRLAQKYGGLVIRNLIRQLQDRTVLISADGGEFADAYTDSNGILNTVNTGSTDANFNGVRYETTASATSYIYHNIPSGTFSSTISSCIGSAVVHYWEDGAAITYKLTSASADDTGWLPINEVSIFTAFTGEPDELVIKLEPKASGPTALYPAIVGFGVLA